MRALNLLHYPSLARQQKVFHRWWSSLAGLLLGVAGFLLNWHYKHKADKRAIEEHYRKMGMYE